MNEWMNEGRHAWMDGLMKEGMNQWQNDGMKDYRNGMGWNGMKWNGAMECRAEWSERRSRKAGMNKWLSTWVSQYVHTWYICRQIFLYTHRVMCIYIYMYMYNMFLRLRRRGSWGNLPRQLLYTLAKTLAQTLSKLVWTPFSSASRFPWGPTRKVTWNWSINPSVRSSQTATVVSRGLNRQVHLRIWVVDLNVEESQAEGQSSTFWGPAEDVPAGNSAEECPTW